MGSGKSRAQGRSPIRRRRLRNVFCPRHGTRPNARAAGFPSDAGLAGIYQTSRRAESSFVRLSALLAQFVIKIDVDGPARRFFAIWPFGRGAALKRIEPNLYQGP